MSCDSCTDKEKQQYQDKLRTDAKKQAEKEQAPVAICKGTEGEFLLDAAEAYRTGQVVVDVIHYMRPVDAG